MKVVPTPGALSCPRIRPLTRPSTSIDGSPDRRRVVHVSTTARHHVLSGPLENWRRLGKRQLMNIDNLQTSAMLSARSLWIPPWLDYLALGINISTTEVSTSNPFLVDHCPSQGALIQLSRWTLSALPAWLSSRSVSPCECAPVTSHSNSDSKHEDTPLSRKTRVTLEIISTGHPENIIPALRDLAHVVRTQLAMGQATEVEVLHLLALVPDSIAQVKLLQDCSGQLHSLCFAVLRGIISIPMSRTSAMSAELWNALLFFISKLRPEPRSLRLFQITMELAPESCHGFMRAGILAVLESFFSSWSSLAGSKRRHTARGTERQAGAELKSTLDDDRIRILVAALGVFAFDGQDGTLSSATDLVCRLQSEVSRTYPDIIHLVWLATLAQHPLVTEEAMWSVLTRFYGPEATTWSTLDLSRLLLASWTSRRPSSDSSQLRAEFERRIRRHGQFAPIATLLEMVYEAEPQRLFSRGPTALRYTRFSQFTASLWTLFHRLSRERDVIASLAAAAESATQGMKIRRLRACRLKPDPTSVPPDRNASRTIPTSLVRLTATTAGDVRLAVALRQIVYRFPEVFPDQFRLGRWDWRSWLCYIDQMLEDPGLSPTTVWELLGVVGSDHPMELLNQTSALLDPSARGDWARECAKSERARGVADPVKKWAKHSPPWTRPSRPFVRLVRRLIEYFASSPNYDAYTAYRAVRRGVFYLGWARAPSGGANVARAVAVVMKRVLDQGSLGDLITEGKAVDTREASLDCLLGVVKSGRQLDLGRRR